MSNGEQVKKWSKWDPCGTCVTTEEDGNPKVWIRGLGEIKRANERETCGMMKSPT